MCDVGIVIGTGPSLSDVADELRQLKAEGRVRLFAINNTYKDFPLDENDCWIACDPSWHRHYGQVEGDFDKWHWDKDICEQYGYRYIEGVWLPGLSLDKSKLSLGHSSGWQALNLALHYNCRKILLVGYDMTYRDNEPRHYFTGVSDVAGEYPQPLRKWSQFAKPDKTGLFYNYKEIADQSRRGEIPPVINCTPRSAMHWFPIHQLSDCV